MRIGKRKLAHRLDTEPPVMVITDEDSGDEVVLSEDECAALRRALDYHWPARIEVSGPQTVELNRP